VLLLLYDYYLPHRRLAWPADRVVPEIWIQRKSCEEKLCVVYSIHQKHVLFVLQIAAASAIRNIVSRTKRFSDEFVELDVETLLNEVVKRHPAAEEGVKAALRDLELKVHLKEEWTGTSSHMIRGD
jgi:hypothetical protein